MVRFDPNTLYSRKALEKMVQGVVGLDTFLDALGLRKNTVFRDAFWGWEILEASKQAPSYSERAPTATMGRTISSAPRRRRKGSDEGGPTGRLSAEDL